MYVVICRQEVKSEAEEWANLGSAEPTPGQVLDEAAASTMGDVGARKVCQSTQKTGLNEFHYTTVCDGDDVVKCLVLKELELTAGENTVKVILMGNGAVQQAGTVRLQSSAEYDEKMWDRCLKTEKGGSNDSSDGERSSTVRGLESNCQRKKNGVWFFYSDGHKKSVRSLILGFCCTFRFALSTVSSYMESSSFSLFENGSYMDACSDK